MTNSSPSLTPDVPHDPIIVPTTSPLFNLGRLLFTPAAMEALEVADAHALNYLVRHKSGDFGELDAEDRQTNVEAVRYGGRILSAYTLKTGVKIWIITEADRSATTILLPGDY